MSFCSPEGALNEYPTRPSADIEGGAVHSQANLSLVSLPTLRSTAVNVRRVNHLLDLHIPISSGVASLAKAIPPHVRDS